MFIKDDVCGYDDALRMRIPAFPSSVIVRIAQENAGDRLALERFLLIILNMDISSGSKHPESRIVGLVAMPQLIESDWARER